MQKNNKETKKKKSFDNAFNFIKLKRFLRGLNKHKR